MPEFIRILQKESWLFVLSRCIYSMVVGLLSWPIIIWILDIYDLYSPILEKNSMQWVLFASTLSLLTCLLLIIRALITKPRPAEIAQEVERANPQLHDLLNCAVELDHKSKKTELSFMEKRVLDITEKEACSIAWGKGTRPNSFYWVSIVIGLGIGTGLALWGAGRSPVQKAFDFLSNERGLIVSTTLTGSTVEDAGPATNEFTRGSDVSIFADIIRGHRGKKLAFIEFGDDQNGGLVEMLETPVIGRFEFVVPALKEPFKYRVKTPSINTAWHTIIPYDPPSLKVANWKVYPPSYLKMEPFTHEGFGYVKVPEASQVELELEIDSLPQNVGATLISTEGNFSLEGNLTSFTHTFTLLNEWKGYLELADLDKPMRAPVVFDDIVIAPIPDESPLVEITEPAKDLQLAADATFLVEVFASDDHAVSDVRIRVEHAGDSEEQTIFVDPVEKEKRLTYVFDLNERALAVGDVLTYMALASDNKEPESQLARSEIYFIEVLPPEGNSTDAESGDMEGESKEIPVRDFINKTKKIIRSTYDALLETAPSKKERLSIALSSDALGLKHEMTKVYDENEGAFPVVDGIDLGELLNEATYHIEQTEIYTGDQMLQESLEPSGKTLRKLVQLYALMQKMQKQKSKGKGQPTEGEETADEAAEPREDEQGKDPSEELRELAADLNKLKEMQSRQKGLNRDMGRLAEAGVEGDKNKETSKKQEDLRRDLESLRDEWYKNSGKLGDVASLDQAGEEMKGAAGNLRRDQPREAQPQGELASEALKNAIAEVENKMAAIAGDMVEQLGEKAGGLAMGQHKLADSTGKAQSGEGEKLKESQEQLNEMIKDLLEDIDQTARAMGSFNENATEDLLKEARKSKENGIERSGKRAENSLLYEAFPQAKREESKVAENLEELEEGLENVENKIRNLGNGELQELAKRLQENLEELPGLGDEELKEEAEELAKALGSMSNASENQRLRNITKFFEQMAINEAPSKSKSMAAAAMAEALEVVEQFFWQEAKQDLLRRNLEASSAPSRYKRQVEEYFRRIAEGE
jgi:hypothetical protein